MIAKGIAGNWLKSLGNLRNEGSVRYGFVVSQRLKVSPT